MKNLRGVGFTILLFFFLSALVACSSSSDSDEVGIAGAESTNSSVTSVSAVAYKDAATVEIGFLNEKDEFESIQDGQYVDPGTKTLAVKVEGGTYDISRVLLSNGGPNQVEALKQGDYYVCDYIFSNENILQSVLVQVIHSNGLATKEKLVFKTHPFALDNELVKEGLGLVVGQDILDGLKDDLGEILDNYIAKVFEYIDAEGTDLITEISYGDGDSDTVDVVVNLLEIADEDAYPSAIFHTNLTIKGVNLSAINLSGSDLVETYDNDLTIDLYIALKDIGKEESKRLILDFLGSPDVSFAENFFLKGAVEDILASGLTKIDMPPIAFDMDGLLDALDSFIPSSLSLNESLIDLHDLFDKLKIDLTKYLFIDLYGIPEATIYDVAAIGSGLYVANYDDITWGSNDIQPPPLFLDVSIEDALTELLGNMIDEMIKDTKEKNKGLITELSYGDDNPDTADVIINFMEMTDKGINPYPYIIFHTNFTIKRVNLLAVNMYGYSLIKTSDNDLSIDLYTELRNKEDGSTVIDLKEPVDASFAEYFSNPWFLESFARGYIEEMIKGELINIDEIPLDTGALLNGMDLDIDISGFLSDTSKTPLFPDVTTFVSPSAWELSKPAGANLSIVISQYNINQVLSALLNRDFEWDIRDLFVAVLGEESAEFIPEPKEGEQTCLRFSVPPVIDLRSSQIRLAANDVILEYRLNGTSQWEVSLDLNFVVHPCIEKGSLNLYLNPAPEYCCFHVMRDNLGNLGIFDHSKIIQELFAHLPEMLGDSPGDPLLSIGLDTLDPTIVFKDVESPVSISSKGGCLYIDMAIRSFDISGLLDELL